jgi:hypothetical protein
VLFKITDNAQEAADEILGFYRNYHSRRFVGSNLVMRLQNAPTDTELATLNEQFAFLLSDGVIERTEPLSAEVHDDDELDKPRIKFRFDKVHHGGLRQLINAVNQFGTAPSGRPEPRHYQEPPGS